MKLTSLSAFIFLMFALAFPVRAEEPTEAAAPDASEEAKGIEAAPLDAPSNYDELGDSNSDGQPMNKRHSIILIAGPPGLQNGHPNPIFIPPASHDFQLTYVHHSGLEIAAARVPGITGGFRYRGGSWLYGAIGGGLIQSLYAIGPGVYSAIGASFSRSNSFTFEMEFKQAIGINIGAGDTIVTMPYAFRIGAGFNW